MEKDATEADRGILGFLYVMARGRTWPGNEPRAIYVVAGDSKRASPMTDDPGDPAVPR